MANGEVYVEVDASVVNGGIAPMAIVSSNPEPSEGQTYVVVWILWKYEDSTGKGGYTGIQWYMSDTNNGLRKLGYTTNKEFETYLVNNPGTNLDDILSDWDARSKSAFLNDHYIELSGSGCLYFMGE